MYKVFLFDLGNVLAKPLDDKTLYEKLQCKVGYQEFLQYLYFDEAAVGAHTGHVSDDDHVKAVIQNCGTKVSMEEYYKIYMNLDTTLNADTVAIAKMVKEKGYKIGLLSSLRFMDYKRYETQLTELGFDYLFLSYELGYIKPAEGIYRKVMDRLACAPEEVVFFDDGIVNVEGAAKLGINAYQVTGDTIKDVFEEQFGERL